MANPEKVRAVMAMESPKCTEDLQSVTDRADYCLKSVYLTTNQSISPHFQGTLEDIWMERGVQKDGFTIKKMVNPPLLS